MGGSGRMLTMWSLGARRTKVSYIVDASTRKLTYCSSHHYGMSCSPGESDPHLCAYFHQWRLSLVIVISPHIKYKKVGIVVSEVGGIGV